VIDRSASARVTCLRDGEKVAEWESAPAKQDMINAMVGRDFTFEHHAPPPRGDHVVLRVENATRGKAFRDVSFDVARGEILGFAGLIGAGRTEVVRAISGADRLDAGTIEVDGRRVSYTSPKGAIRAGVFMVPEDRKGQGLLLERGVGENIALPWESKIGRGGMVTAAGIDRVAQEQKRRFDIRGRMTSPVGRMSGGNQQKVLIGKCLVENPKVFIIDEPTRGVDVGAKMAIYEIIRSLAASGVAVIVVSSELEEVLGLAHQVLVMAGGRQRGILSREDATPERVMSLAVAA
jgi:ribose transport system ATP-binding protein